MAKQFLYIEDTTPEELKLAILSDDEVLFKHKDCSLIFSSDKENLYASDIDDLDFDPFHDGQFSKNITSYYGSTDLVFEFLSALSDVGLTLDLSDHFNNHDIRFKDLILS